MEDLNLNEKDWCKKHNKNRATYFRQRKKIGLGKSYDFIDCETKCYFCNGKSILIHHINEDKKDNNFSNLIPLCKCCHSKLHIINKLFAYSRATDI